MHETLLAWASNRGCRVAWGPRTLAAESKASLAALRPELDDGLFTAEFESLAAPEALPDWATVLMVALPRPAHRVSFDLVGGGSLEAVIPPTYVHYQTTLEDLRQDLARSGLPGARVEHLHGPCKTLAARLGLVRYGRNNIAYAEGLGSYVQLGAFITDAPLPPAPPPGPPALLPECADCRRCLQACPTGAIAEDRILIAAHRCLTFASEYAGPWPDWVPAARHHCLVGCLACQRACPANPKLEVEDTGLRFSAEETQALLEQPEALPPSAVDGIRRKLAWLGQPGLQPALGRNLAALLRRGSSSSAAPVRSGSSPA